MSPPGWGRSHPTRVIVAVTGATGTELAVCVLRKLGERGVERHLVVSAAARRTARYELPEVRLEAEAEKSYGWRDIGAAPASGSFPVDAMIIVPCSANTLASIANGISDNLITRAADVTLKERRRLVLCFRETPFHAGHIRAMDLVTTMGGIVMPPVLAYYTRPKTLAEANDHIAIRLVGMLGFGLPDDYQWLGDDAERQQE